MFFFFFFFCFFFFILLQEKKNPLSMQTCCEYPLEAPQSDTSNEYPQHVHSWRNKLKIIYLGIHDISTCNVVVVVVVVVYVPFSDFSGCGPKESVE